VPALRSVRGELSATFVRVLAYVGAMAVLAVLAAKIFGTPLVEAAIEPATRTEWTGVERPFRAFALTIPEFAEPEPDYAIRRHATGGGRKDIMTWGKPDSAGSRLMIEIYRPGKELKRFGDAESAAAARTSDLGGPYGLKPTDPIDSKFGRVATFGFTASAGGQRRHCLGFVRAFSDPLLQIAGWYCKGGAEVVERQTLSCALDRVTLLMAASEPKVTELFAKAELQRKFCSPKSKQERTSNTRRNDWIDAAKQPKLRGRAAAR
jgi:hypothetical protein